MFRTFLLLSAAAGFIFAPAKVSAQNFDTSGSAGLNGQYLFRYVTLFNDSNGNVTEACSLTGTITFDGVGTYTVNAQLYDDVSPSGSCASLGGGTYGVQSNGMMQMDNPLFAATLYGSFSAPVITASTTEDDYYDLFVAVQAPQSGLTNSNLNGAYTLGSLEFPGASTNGGNLTHQAYFTLNANGQGGISPITLTGSAENLNITTSTGLITQNVSGATYSLSGTSGGTLTIPNSNNSQLVSGTKILYLSADGNFLLGGSSSSADIIFGFRAPSSPATSLISGTYYTAGMDADLSGDGGIPLDSFWGSINANGAGTLLWHERYDDVVDVLTYDQTFSSTVSIGSNGTYYDPNFGITTLESFNGQATLTIGSGDYFSFYIGMHAPNYSAGSNSVWINPIGITNAANYTPITNAYAPGELVNIYGNFGAASQVDTSLPVPTNLGGVQVLVNGIAAPVYYVSANQISALIPYAISQYYFATFQVIVNGVKSNSVTVYSDLSSPGVYTANQNGLGTSALLHANYTAVTDSSPATPGETVSLYLNGLGTVTPTVADGAPGPSSPLSYSDEYNNNEISIALDDYVDNFSFPNITYAGLAPGFPGLYQINFTIPTRGLGNGHVDLIVNTFEGETDMSTISLTGFGHNSGVAEVPVHQALSARAGAKAAAKKARAQVKKGTAATKDGVAPTDTRRALPARIVE